MSATANPFFTPTQISGCQLWLDGTDPAGTGTAPVNGASLSIWRDKSSNRFTGTAINSPTYRASVQNGLGVIRFNGTNQYINFGNILNLGTNGLSIFTLTRFSVNAGKENGIVGKASYRANFGRWGFLYTELFGNVGITGFLEDTAGSGTSFAYNPSLQFNLYTYINNRSSVNTLFTNGSQSSQATFSITPTSLSNTDFLYVGAYPDNTGQAPLSGLYLNGDIAEVIVYFSTLTTAQRQQVEGYLAWKWGLQTTLPTSHPYKSSPIPPLLSPLVSLPQASQPATQPITWFPTQISGCQLWLDAIDPAGTGVTPGNGTTITTWRDKSGNGRNAVGINSPTYSNNSINFIRASSQYFTLPNGTLPTGNLSYAYFVICSFNDDTVRSGLIGGGSYGVTSAMFGFRNLGGEVSRTLLTYWWSNDLFPAPANAYQMNTNLIATSLYTSGSTRAMYVNGSFLFSDTPSARNQTSGSNTVGLTGLNEYMSGTISEILVYSASLSTSQRQEIEGYLAWKWGLQANLPASHPFKSFPPFLPAAAFPPRALAQTASWNPLRISGMNAWYDGADPLGTGRVPGFNTALSTWVDKSGNGRNASGGVTPTFVNGGVSFNGTSQYYTMSVPYSSNYSIFLVATNTTAIQCYYFSRDSLGGGREPTFIQGYIGAGIGLEWFEGADRATIATTPASPFLASIDHIQGTSIVGWYYGSQAFNISQTRAYAANAWDRLGTATNTVGFYGGTMKDLIFYSNAVTNQQRQNIEGYLAWKWGLQGNLPGNHPFKLWPPPP